DALWAQIGKVLDLFTPEECANYFASCGYVNKQTKNALGREDPCGLDLD
ncbi:hypothetical protein C8R14_1761, partial [Nitrosomonas eutropha]